MVEQILKNLGLTENQTRVFIGATKAGLAPISQIARQSGVTRTYVYELLEELKQMGLLAEVEEKGVKKIQALDYGGLLAYVGRKQREIKILEKELLQAEGEFQALHTKIPAKTKVRFFEGVEGIKSINAEIQKDLKNLKLPHEFYVVFSVDRMENILPGWVKYNQHIYYEPFMNKRAIINETPMLQSYLSQIRAHQQNNFTYKIWPKRKKEFPTDTLCWQNKIAYLDMKEYPSGIIIENNAIAETFIMWFENMWENLNQGLA